MKEHGSKKRWVFAAASCGMLLILGLVAWPGTRAEAFGLWRPWHKQRTDICDQDGPPMMEVGGTWYWLRSPDEEKRVVMSLYNRYCIRCHDVDGRGKWDIPGVPDLTNAAWQASREDGQLARRILEGRGAVMPQFRGTLSLEEAWAMARYLRTFAQAAPLPPPEVIIPSPKKLEKPGK